MRARIEELIDGGRRLVVEWHPLDVVGALHDFDDALLRECDRSPRLSDWLLALELMARRVEEATQRRAG